MTLQAGNFLVLLFNVSWFPAHDLHGCRSAATGACLPLVSSQDVEKRFDERAALQTIVPRGRPSARKWAVECRLLFHVVERQQLLFVQIVKHIPLRRHESEIATA